MPALRERTAERQGRVGALPKAESVESRSQEEGRGEEGEGRKVACQKCHFLRKETLKLQEANVETLRVTAPKRSIADLQKAAKKGKGTK